MTKTTTGTTRTTARAEDARTWRQRRPSARLSEHQQRTDMGKRCRGIIGLIFGHKFHHATMEWVEYSDHCVRCGMPKGGWASAS